MIKHSEVAKSIGDLMPRNHQLLPSPAWNASECLAEWEV